MLVAMVSAPPTLRRAHTNSGHGAWARTYVRVPGTGRGVIASSLTHTQLRERERERERRLVTTAAHGVGHVSAIIAVARRAGAPRPRRERATGRETEPLEGAAAHG